MITRAYVMTAVTYAGVPDADREDAVQDVLLAMWREQIPERLEKVFVYRRSIDAARRYGWHVKGIEKIIPERLSPTYQVAAPPMYEDEFKPFRARFRQLVKRLGVRDRVILRAMAKGIPMSHFATRLGISQSRTCHLSRRAVKRMRAMAT